MNSRKSKPGRNGLCYQPARALRHLRAVDPVLDGLIAQSGAFTMRPDQSRGIFESLVRSIIYQQLNGTAAATIHGRLLALWQDTGRAHPTAHDLLDIDDAALRGAGVSGSKAAALRDLAHHVLTGDVPTVEEALELGDGELSARLTRVRGIGQWTVDMLLIFRLGRPDVLPTGDYGVRSGFARAYGWSELPTPRQLTEHGEAWRPYRSVASWYLWRALEQ